MTTQELGKVLDSLARGEYGVVEGLDKDDLVRIIYYLRGNLIIMSQALAQLSEQMQLIDLFAKIKANRPPLKL